MRLWSLHPKYLDARGLTAVWREGLLARAVLRGKTRGYRNHPQLLRFKCLADPVVAIDAYLAAVLKEADARGYCYDSSKIYPGETGIHIPVTRGQVEYEKKHLCTKLRVRDPARLSLLEQGNFIEVNPIFVVVEGEVESWEKVFIRDR